MPVSVVMTKRSEKDGGVEGGREGGAGEIEVKMEPRL